MLDANPFDKNAIFQYYDKIFSKFCLQSNSVKCYLYKCLKCMCDMEAPTLAKK